MRKIFLSILFCVFAAINISAQTTAFTYQGSLKDGANPATGNYDFEFKLFDAASGGAQQGTTLQRLNVGVANGIFTVSLDFGAAPLPGADRFLEIGVRTGGNPGGFQQLLPRQKIGSSPYSIKSLNAETANTAINAAQLGGIAPGGFIQNSASQQASSNFNISGTGTATIFNAATQFDLNGSRILSSPGTLNIFAGTQSGQAITTGFQNSFFGASAGVANTTGNSNAFFGTSAGQANSTGVHNSFFGGFAGQSNTTGNHNTFFGRDAGSSNTTASDNSFFGRSAGESNTTGISNSFFGRSAGQDNNTGGFNSFFGHFAGPNTTSGSDNSFFGFNAGQLNTTGGENAFFGGVAGASNITGTNNTMVGRGADVLFTDLAFATAIGSDSMASLSNSVYLGRPGGEDTVRIPGNLNITGATTINGNLVITSGNTVLIQSPITVTSLGTAGGTALCRNGTNQIANCSSSLRYKTNIGPFSQGMSFVHRLRPIAFDWKDGGMKDVGFGAEDVAKVDPRFVTYNENGEVEGVKYDRLSVVFINAFKEQQEQISTLQTTNNELRQQVNALRAAVCAIKADAEICKTKEK